MPAWLPAWLPAFLSAREERQANSKRALRSLFAQGVVGVIVFFSALVVFFFSSTPI